MSLVEEGHVPVTDLPTKYIEVGRMIRTYRALARRRQLNDQKEERKQMDMLNKAGVL